MSHVIVLLSANRCGIQPAAPSVHYFTFFYFAAVPEPKGGREAQLRSTCSSLDDCDTRPGRRPSAEGSAGPRGLNFADFLPASASELQVGCSLLHIAIVFTCQEMPHL